jgi:hypothetical protein
MSSHINGVYWDRVVVCAQTARKFIYAPWLIHHGRRVLLSHFVFHLISLAASPSRLIQAQRILCCLFSTSQFLSGR